MPFVMILKKLIGDFIPAFANSLNFNGLFRPGETLQLFWIRDLSQVLCIIRNTLNADDWTEDCRFRDGSPLLMLAIFVKDIRRCQP